ncbi:S9 family peptidase [Subsaximicrobium wynnwilliamsii]|uniref:S9 family peptidase n=1 Tax=Subsaximicrobium wynnwilliamsii TaxID=291179 RepID=A0A5C6ZI26_9FLAO|nr:prolyl oligopeptidase family serine peptidase [Subsaximicrobium wynnwilliamsii]TXD83204.1 S9 family peptidase [Subsaximicrobium wynnwilliamsii]TXD88316.1 S9 family peptidase [Subsaximicrobium wynnwilliamsii]TXE03037.1 S9 family peptidase [Subsaximicrobium wynnwilliamsii]
MKKVLLFGILLFCGIMTMTAQKFNQSPLTIKEIMQGDQFIGNLPSNVQWAADGQTIYFDWNPDGVYSDSLYGYKLKDEKINKVDFDTEYGLPSSYGHFNANRTKRLYAKHGDIFLVDVASKATRPITRTNSYEGNPQFTANETKIAFEKGNNIFTWDIASGTTTQITDFTDTKENDEKKDSKDVWLYNDQLALFDVLRERKEKTDARDRLEKRNDSKQAFAIFIGDLSVANQQMSPDGNYVTYLTVKRATNKSTIAPHYITESGYTEDQQTRSKVGDTPDAYKMFIYDIVNRKVDTVSLENLEGLDYVPEYTKDYPDKPYKNDDRIGYISEPVWSADGKSALLDIASNDYKDRWIVLLNIKNGTVTNLDHQHDEAWIAGPGINSWGRSIGWMPNDQRIWFQSEETGYSQLYAMDLKTKTKEALTTGDFEIYEPKISNDKKHWYFTANKIHPGDRQFYSMPINGGAFNQLTTMTGKNEVSLSPDETKMAILYSYSNKPTELYLKENPMFSKKAAPAKQLTESTTEAFKKYKWRDPEIITFKAEDGAKVYARLYQPKPDVKNNAAVIFVHGAGYLQNAHKWWSSYFREYMFHNLLVDNGYTVFDIDYRGSAGYGRDWRTGIYRHMGGKDLSDQVDGANYLVNTHGIDKDKIGIYGGSYGGFITLMGMFNAADTFHAGAAIRSVGDWAAYNHGYTARILNTPVTDSLAYRRSSPIYFADGLKGDLLILHGLVDDNVHAQDMLRLSQRLIELEKHNWDMVLYPMEKHGFAEPSSWTDEYTRIYKLFQESLLQKIKKE